FAQLGVKGTPLGVPDVLPSLQTGMINACYGSPLATLALQWYTKVKYMTKMQLAFGIGAALLTKKAYDKLGPELQGIVQQASKEMQAKLMAQVRGDNDRALASLKQQGLTVVDSPKELVQEFEQKALAIRPELEPSVYKHDLRLKVEKLLADYRAGK